MRDISTEEYEQHLSAEPTEICKGKSANCQDSNILPNSSIVTGKPQLQEVDIDFGSEEYQCYFKPSIEEVQEVQLRQVKLQEVSVEITEDICAAEEAYREKEVANSAGAIFKELVNERIKEIHDSVDMKVQSKVEAIHKDVDSVVNKRVQSEVDERVRFENDRLLINVHNIMCDKVLVLWVCQLKCVSYLLPPLFEGCSVDSTDRYSSHF